MNIDITINYKGIDFDVQADVSPEGKEVRYYPDGSGYPGCAASMNGFEISHKGTDFAEFFFEYDDYEKNLKALEELIWEYLYNQ